MKNQIYTLLATATLALCACAGANKGSATFGEAEPLKAENITVNEILQPRQWTVSNGKVVVVSPQTDSLFYVYSLPDFQYQYMCGTKGEGPNDFSPWAGFLQSGNGDTGTLWMRNKGDDYDYYTVAEKGMYKKGTQQVFLKKGTFGAAI